MFVAESPGYLVIVTDPSRYNSLPWIDMKEAHPVLEWYLFILLLSHSVDIDTCNITPEHVVDKLKKIVITFQE